MKPYYSEGGITIFHGDCLEVMADLGGVDLVVTSPPYNLGVSSGGGLKSALGNGRWARAELAHGYGSHGDALAPEVYAEWQRECLRAMWATLSDEAAIFYNHKPRIQNGIVELPLAWNPGLPLRQIITWARAGGFNYSPTFFVPTYEWIMVFAKPDFRLKSKEASGAGDLWRIPQEANTAHPAPFPIGLPMRAINATRAQAILDPFMGSGTTLRAAKDCGRMAIGIEIEERFCEIAAQRLAQGALAI